MPVEIGLWRLGERPEKLATSTLNAESVLENALEKDLSILAGGLMLVGRQVPTSYGKFIDMLATTASGELIVLFSTQPVV